MPPKQDCHRTAETRPVVWGPLNSGDEHGAHMPVPSVESMVEQQEVNKKTPDGIRVMDM